MSLISYSIERTALVCKVHSHGVVLFNFYSYGIERAEPNYAIIYIL